MSSAAGATCTKAFRTWLEDSSLEKATRSAEQVLKELKRLDDDHDSSPSSDAHRLRSEIFAEINVILFKRLAELVWRPQDELVLSEFATHTEDVKVGLKKIDNPLFLIAKRWFRNLCDSAAKAKLVSPLRRLCLEALEDMKQDLTREFKVIECLELLCDLMEEPDFPDFSLTFLKVQRFSIDATGRHLRRNDQDPVLSAQSCLQSLKILFRHASQALFDSNPCLLLFFETYPRWRDSPLLARNVLQFCVDNALLLVRSTKVFLRYRAELLSGYLTYGADCRELIESLVEIWTKINVATEMRTLVLEALAEDSRENDCVLPCIVIQNAPTAKLKLDAIRACFQAEQEGAIASLPIPLLDAICEVMKAAKEYSKNGDLLEVMEEEDFISELATGLLNSTSATAGRICWVLGEFGPDRNWQAGFHGLRAFSGIVNLSDYERCAVIDALVKFALFDASPMQQKQVFINYKPIVVKTLMEMSLGQQRDLKRNNGKSFAANSRDRALQLIESPLGIGRTVIFGD